MRSTCRATLQTRWRVTIQVQGCTSSERDDAHCAVNDRAKSRLTQHACTSPQKSSNDVPSRLGENYTPGRSMHERRRRVARRVAISNPVKAALRTELRAPREVSASA
jgi:hypothetical protein